MEDPIQNEFLELEKERDTAIARVAAHLATINILVRQNEMLVQQLQKFAMVFEEELEGTNWSPNQQTAVLNEDLALTAQLLDFIALENKELMLNGSKEGSTTAATGNPAASAVPDPTPAHA
jgi:hypothetical protein